MNQTYLAVMKSKWDRKQALKDRLVFGALLLK